VVTFREEDCTITFGKELLPLAYTWSVECGINLDINWESYMLVAEAKMLRAFSARVDGVLVGFSVFFIVSPFRENQELRAQLDALYLAPEYRTAWTGIKFIKFCENCLKIDVTEIMFSSLVKHDYAPVLKYLGYLPIETIHRKRF